MHVKTLKIQVNIAAWTSDMKTRLNSICNRKGLFQKELPVDFFLKGTLIRKVSKI